jgi:L-asparagine transporter-like permease
METNSSIKKIKKENIMKKINTIPMAQFVHVSAVAYLVFVILSDIMKWQQLDHTQVTLAICLIVMTTDIFEKRTKSKRNRNVAGEQ